MGVAEEKEAPVDEEGIESNGETNEEKRGDEEWGVWMFVGRPDVLEGCCPYPARTMINRRSEYMQIRLD